jgi:hypothetical protein
MPWSPPTARAEEGILQSRRFKRAATIGCLLACGSILAGCESMPDLENLFTTQKKLPGERHDVFPGGVPGVAQGVPPQLLKGNHPPPGPDATTALATNAPGPAPAAPGAAPAPQQAGSGRPMVLTNNVPAAAEPPKPEAKRPPKKKVVHAKPRPKPAEPAAQNPPSAQSPWPAPAQQQQPQSPWPAAPGAQSSAPPAPTVWPEPPPAGTFTR